MLMQGALASHSCPQCAPHVCSRQPQPHKGRRKARVARGNPDVGCQRQRKAATRNGALGRSGE